RDRRKDEEQPDSFGAHIAEVQNYLAEQLFSSLPEDQYALLIDIADCDEVTGDLVDQMRGRTGSAATLESIADSIPSLMWAGVHDARIVYRLHPLLLDHLRLRLSLDPARRSRLAANAASW